MSPWNKTKNEWKVWINFSTKLVQFYNLLEIYVLQFCTKLVQFLRCSC